MIEVQVPPASINFNNYRKRLKFHLDSEELKDIGVHPKDYSTHSLRLGGLSFMVADNVVTPAFIKTVPETNGGTQ